MQNWKLGSAVAVLAATVIAGSTVAASAQAGGGNGMMYKKKPHGYAARVSHPLTVRPPAPAAAVNPLTAPIGLAGQIVTAPLSGLSQAFGYGAIGGPARPLPIVARYAGVGPVTTTVPQGWAQDVPIAANGPIYKLEPVSNAGGASPFAVIAAPITAATTLAAAPINAAGALVGAPPPPPPVF